MFSEEFRNTWFDKAHALLSFVKGEGRPLYLLPQVYWLNDHALGSEDTAPKGAAGAARKHASWQRLQRLADELGLVCPDLCPCVRREDFEVEPPQGFHIRSTDPGAQAGAEWF